MAVDCVTLIRTQLNLVDFDIDKLSREPFFAPSEWHRQSFEQVDASKPDVNICTKSKAIVA